MAAVTIASFRTIGLHINLGLQITDPRVLRRYGRRLRST